MVENLAGAVLENLVTFLPFRIVHSYQRGVRFSRGVAQAAQLEPGVHWFLPLFQSIEVVSVASEVLNLPTQTVTTLDGEPVSFSANIEYQVVDVVAMYCNVQDFEASVIGAAMGHLATKVRKNNYLDLVAEQSPLERSLRDTLTTRLKEWGVKVLDVRLTDFVRARAYRVYGDPGTQVGAK